MELNKLEKGDSRIPLLERRLVAENKINEHIYTTQKGKTVRYGDTIQLYHVFSNSYVRFSTERLHLKNIFSVKLSESQSPETHLRVLPKASLKKEGDVINSMDQFNLSCPANNTSLGFIEDNNKALDISPPRKGILEIKPPSDDKRITKHPISPEDIPDLYYLPLTELSTLYSI